MNTFFECKVKYQKVTQSGKEKTVSESYLLDAMSFTEAEARITTELEPYISGESFLTTIKHANFSELVLNDESDNYFFKCKVGFISLNEENGTEKTTNTYMLVQADGVKQAYDSLEKYLKDSVTDYRITSVSESPIIDVFQYGTDAAKKKLKSTKKEAK